MHAVFLKIGGLTIHWYGVMMALGFFAGLANWTWLGRRKGWDFAFCSDLLFWAMVGVVVGARGAYVLGDLPYFLERPWRIVRLDQGGLVFYGGLLGGVAAMLMFARRRGVSGWDLADFSGTSLPLGHALGRIGCFLNGCCHGKPAPSWLGVSYPVDSYPWHQQIAEGLIAKRSAMTVPVHAVQLYEAAFNLALYGLLVVVFRRGARRGTVTALYLMAYPAGRFALESLRADHELFVGRLTGAQAWGIVLFLVGLAIWMWHRRPAARPLGDTARPAAGSLRGTSCD